MKHKHIFWVPSITFIITFILPLLTLIACNAKPEKLGRDKKFSESPAIQAIQAQIKQHKREFITTKLKLRVQKYEKMLNDHILYAWIEDGDAGQKGESDGYGGTQYGMGGHNQAFGVIKSPYDSIYTADANYNSQFAKDARLKVYLAFEYYEDLIRALGAVLNKLAASAQPANSPPNEYNKLLQEIADKTGEYACNYFEVAFGELFKKQNNINSLSYNMLQELDQKLDKLIAEREMHVKDAKTIYNDFNADKDQIRTGDAAKLKDYLIKYRPKFENSFGAVKTLAGEIKNILDAI